MDWLSHTFQTGLFLDNVWTAITWIAFFFKLASFAFVGPLFGLIIFDFCLWIWRLIQLQPTDEAQPNHITIETKEQRTNPTVSPNGTSSATALSTNPVTSQRRNVYLGQTGD